VSTTRDRIAFLGAIERQAPEVLTSIKALPVPLYKSMVHAWARRSRLDIPGLEWIQEGLLSGTISFPAPVMGEWPKQHDIPLDIEWQPGADGLSRAKFIGHARQALDLYADRVEKWAKENGALPPAQRSRQLKGRSAPWDMLVCRVVLRWHYSKIAKQFFKDRDTKPEAAEFHVRAAAKRLGVNLPMAS